SDMNRSAATDELEAQGIPVAIGHRPENIEVASLLIRTAAAHDDNPEVAAARDKGIPVFERAEACDNIMRSYADNRSIPATHGKGIPVFERAEAWGILMRGYANAICISSTHGKTTTTSMITQIFMEAQRDPTVMIGGTLPLIHASHRVGHGDTIILESCEYCNSFLNFYPTDRKSTRLNSSHVSISYAVFCLKKKKNTSAQQ